MISDEAEMYLTDVDKAFLGSRNKKQRAGWDGENNFLHSFYTNLA